MNVSLICACKNRYKPLMISLSSWLLVEEIKEKLPVFGKEIFEDKTHQWKVNDLTNK